MYIHTHTYIHIYTSKQQYQVYTQKYMQKCTCMSIQVSTQMYIWKNIINMQYTYIYIYKCVHTHISMHKWYRINIFT